MQKLLLEMAHAVREVVRPWVLELRGAEVVGGNAHGDATFAIDAEAERIVAEVSASSGLNLAVYSESSGLSSYGTGSPELLLIVDPVDGTRNATCGFDSCMASIAAAPYGEQPTLGDVQYGVLVDLVGTGVFSVEKGGACNMSRDGQTVGATGSETIAEKSLRWSLNTAGRPARLIFPVMADLIDATSLTGSFHSSNSTTFALSRIATGQLHAHVDLADRIYADVPGTQDLFPLAGDHHLTGSQPHDLAAAMLLVHAVGGVVTDAWGSSLADVPLLSEGPEANLSTVAAGNAATHEAMIRYLDAHVSRARRGLERG